MCSQCCKDTHLVHAEHEGRRRSHFLFFWAQDKQACLVRGFIVSTKKAGSGDSEKRCGYISRAQESNTTKMQTLFLIFSYPNILSTTVSSSVNSETPAANPMWHFCITAESVSFASREQCRVCSRLCEVVRECLLTFRF